MSKGGGTEIRGGETKILRSGGKLGQEVGVLKKKGVGWNPLTNYVYIAKPAISKDENFIKVRHSEHNINKCFTIKDLNSNFNGIGNPFFLLYLNIN